MYVYMVNTWSTSEALGGLIKLPGTSILAESKKENWKEILQMGGTTNNILLCKDEFTNIIMQINQN